MNSVKPIVLIIEDDAASAELLVAELQKRTSVDVLPVVSSLAQAREVLQAEIPDFLFIDIELPDGNGIDFWNEVRTESVCAVFYTAYDKYVLDALRAQALDFLLKPLDTNELDSALNRFFQRRMLTQSRDQASSCHPGSLLIGTLSSDKLVVQCSSIGYFIFLPDRRLWQVVLKDGRRILLKHHTTSESILRCCADFVQVHKTIIINVTYLSLIQGNECIMLPPFEGHDTLIVSKNYRRRLLAQFNSL